MLNKTTLDNKLYIIISRLRQDLGRIYSMDKFKNTCLLSESILERFLIQGYITDEDMLTFQDIAKHTNENLG